jgi:two-component system, sensor histidine kinase and response regulator
LAVLDQAKSDFLRLISHELRTPLSGVLGIAELAFRECGDQPMALKLRELFDQARSRIIALLEDALLLTDIELRPEAASADHCLLSSILQNAIEQSGPLARARGVPLPELPEISQTVRGRTHLMIRALRSLLETAVKFSAEGQPVQCSLEQKANAVQITIAAIGRTIPSKSLPAFFDVLAIGESITPGGDLGLAPAVAERLVTAIGGRLQVENLEPPGIRFDLQLPIACPR